MKELYTFAEVAPLLDQGSQLSFTRHITASVSISQPKPDRTTINALMVLSWYYQKEQAQQE